MGDRCVSDRWANTRFSLVTNNERTMTDIIKWLTDDGWLLRNSQIITKGSKHEQMVAYIHVYKTMVTLSMFSIQFVFGVSEIIAIYIYIFMIYDYLCN
jgi:hypothetical protein